MFASSGFPLPTGSQANPCGTAYHTSCISVGAPFTSRRTDNAGLCFPLVEHWPSFICEACTVRAVQGRELCFSHRDMALLCFERMRMIDMASYWSLGTHKAYQSKLRTLDRFGKLFHVHVLPSLSLSSPPSSHEIPLMWAQVYQCLQRSKRRMNPDGTHPFVKVDTARQLRSAASQWYTWNFLLAHPGRLIHSKSGELVVQRCRPTDSFGGTLFYRGLSTRLGVDVQPAVALLRRHVVWLNDYLDVQFRSASSGALRRDIAKAGLANLFFYLGWLRSNEGFSTCWNDFTVTEPADWAAHDLPTGVGSIGVRLLPETKSMRSRTADVVLAYTTRSGLSIGIWWHRARRCSGLTVPHASTFGGRLFVHDNGTHWTSRYFRHTYLYPSLEIQRAAGDAFLQKFDDSIGNTLADKFWSMHSYRRLAETEVEKMHDPPRRPATKEEIYEHGRWELKRSSEAINIQYREWTLADRVKITLHCM